MRVAGLAFGALLLMCGAATAQSYQFSYTGHTLTVLEGYALVPNATYVTASFSLPASVMPAPGQCAYNLVPSLNYVADGNFNSVSLPPVYTVYESFDVCLDSTGKKITAASLTYQAYINNTFPLEGYLVNTGLVNAKGRVFDVVTSCQCIFGQDREETGRGGKWKLKKIN
jgi:hypothetical protein